MEWILYILLALVLLAVVAGLVMGLPSYLRYRRISKM